MLLMIIPIVIHKIMIPRIMCQFVNDSKLSSPGCISPKLSFKGIIYQIPLVLIYVCGEEINNHRTEVRTIRTVIVDVEMVLLTGIESNINYFDNNKKLSILYTIGIYTIHINIIIFDANKNIRDIHSIW